MKPGTRVNIASEGQHIATGTVREYEPPLDNLGEGLAIDRHTGGLPVMLYRYPGRAQWHVWGSPDGPLYDVTEVA